MPSRNVPLGLTLLVVFSLPGAADAADWSRFRGPNGGGVSADDAPVPVDWNDTRNLKWKVKLPGPGASSPIVVGPRIFVTCWSGYGVDGRNPGDLKNLKRHLVCLDRKTGEIFVMKAGPKLELLATNRFADGGDFSSTPAISDGELLIRSSTHLYCVAAQP